MSRRTPFDVDKLRADIEAGRTLVSIADEYDCSQRAVPKAMRLEGIIGGCVKVSVGVWSDNPPRPGTFADDQPTL